MPGIAARWVFPKTSANPHGRQTDGGVRLVPSVAGRVRCFGPKHNRGSNPRRLFEMSRRSTDGGRLGAESCAELGLVEVRRDLLVDRVQVERGTHHTGKGLKHNGEADQPNQPEENEHRANAGTHGRASEEQTDTDQAPDQRS